MFMWTKLHDLAAPRGDGLRTEILELIANRQSVCSGNVEDISAYLMDHFSQAGPVPFGKLEGDLPEGVLPFRKQGQLPAEETRRPKRKI